MILVNLMRSDVRIESGGEHLLIPASGRAATVVEHPLEPRLLDVDGVGVIPVVEVQTSVIGVPPDSHSGVGYLVTYKTLNTMHALGFDTSDVYAPDALIRDDTGRVVGCRQLMQLKVGSGR